MTTIFIKIPISFVYTYPYLYSFFYYRLSDKRDPIQKAVGINGSCKTNICDVLLPKNADRFILPAFKSLQYEIMNKNHTEMSTEF